MHEWFEEFKRKLEKYEYKIDKVARHRGVIYSVGLITGASGAISVYRIWYGDRVLILPKHAYQALINEEIDFVRFSSIKYSEYSFIVTLNKSG